MTTAQTAQTSTDIRPFRVDIPEEALDDLRRRLDRTRFPAPAPDDSWDYGTPVSYLRDMAGKPVAQRGRCSRIWAYIGVSWSISQVPSPKR